MFTKEELKIVFDVFKNLETEDIDTKTLKEKMRLMDEMMQIADEANQKTTEIQDKINNLYKKEN